MSISTNKKSPNYQSKHQHKLIVLISTLQYINNKYKKYSQQNILYYYNENLKRNGQTPVKLKTLQKYLYKLEKEIKVTTNYHKHLGVNCGTEIYYKLNYSKKECYQKINQFFKEKKETRFQRRVNNHYSDKFPLRGSVNLEECLSNTNNNIKEEKKKQVENFQVINYANKCNFYCKKILPIVLNFNISKNEKIKILKTVKGIEIKLIKSKNTHLNKSYFKEKQNKLKQILENTQKEFEKNGYNAEQLKTNIQKIHEKYKNKPHFIIEYQKYNDLSKIKRKLEKSIELKKENPQKNYEHIRINILNILIDRLKNIAEIEVLKPIIKNYLNSKKKLGYNKVFGSYYYELLKMLENENNAFNVKELSKKVI
ncbi:plasmid maintenance protein [Borreliella valaisiana]|uniref:plasmid maintenance protein n=1 Tax=Borreliella valaisiana TaxID=62088 RepID=UPI003B2250BF